MRKLIKKSLACCLVVVLTLTAMVGVFATSAGANATVTAANVEVANGETSVTVPVTIDVADGFYAAYIQVASEFGALTAVSVPADADYDVTADGYTAVDLATGKMLVMSIYGDDLRNDMTSAVINCTFTADAAPAAGTYAVTVTCPDVDVPAADWAESVVALTPVDGVITVAAHECTEVIDAAVAPTCTETGLTEGKHCSECGKVIVAQEVVDALGHAWVDGEITYTDCTSAGNMAQSCSRCDATQTVAVDPKGHTEVAYKDVAATCTTVGYTGGTYCSECNAIITERTEVPVIPHNYVDGKCDVCGEADPDYVPPVEGPVLDKNIKIGTHTISMGDTFGIGFRYVLSSLSSDYASYRFDIKRTADDGSFNFDYKYVSIETATPHAASDQLMISTYYGIELFALTAPIEYTLHCFDAEGNEIAYSETMTTTLADVAVAYHDSTSNVKIKKVIADLIQVGAAALTHFTNGKDCDFATLPLPTIDSEYVSTELLEDLTKFTDAEGRALTVAAGVTEKPYLSMRFTEVAENKDKYSYVISYHNALTGEDPEDPISSDELSAKSGYVFGYYRALPIFASDADVTIELYEAGTTDAVATYHYSLETYYDSVLTKSANPTLKALVQELAELAQSFRVLRNI